MTLALSEISFFSLSLSDSFGLPFFLSFFLFFQRLRGKEHCQQIYDHIYDYFFFFVKAKNPIHIESNFLLKQTQIKHAEFTQKQFLILKFVSKTVLL
jgi:hypothetical protein